ncbi:SpoIIE family protein phosphatase [Paractinoplanes globisporus]|uniref:SpoIIE family protein phosphatase n=1 Tax=Paractinoplanes globisporus TaxID=113565 RepID=A0ABW6W9F0_9ACTN|nr:SpoIIE family protein phosphatase [Actinoplanes globisporus]
MATVLVVDDDAPSREFMRTLLRYRGHRVEQASDGDSALVMAASRPPDAVITDVLMPGLDGYELARALRGDPATRHVPIVFSTAHYGLQEIQPLAYACDVHDVILKPAQPSIVLATIDSLLDPGRVSVSTADQVAETQRLARAGTWEFDLETSTVLISRSLRDVLGLPSTRLAPHELLQGVHPSDAAGIASMVEKARRTGLPVTSELRVASPHGMVRELIISCRAVTEPVPRLWGAAQDVTAIRAEARADLQVQVDWHAVRRTIDAFHGAVLPATLPAVAGTDVATVYLPAPERLDIGATWYDAQAVSGGRLMLSVGKVAGHDRHPAAVMGQALAALRAYAHEDPEPAAVLGRLNRFLAGTCQDDSFVTAVVALYDPETGHLRVANGGHPAPVVVARDRDGGVVARLLTASGPLMGALSTAVFPQHDLHLPAGSAFCAYTDGLTDRIHDPASTDARQVRRVAAEAFERLDRDSAMAAEAFAEDVVRDMLGGAAPDDDVCLAVLLTRA